MLKEVRAEALLLKLRTPARKESPELATRSESSPSIVCALRVVIGVSSHVVDMLASGRHGRLMSSKAPVYANWPMRHNIIADSTLTASYGAALFSAQPERACPI